MSDTVKLSALLDDSRAAIDTVVAASASAAASRGLVERALGLVGDKVQEGLIAACDQDLGKLLVSGWSKASELHAYAKHPPGETIRMVLGEHAQAITIDPELKLTVNGLPVHDLHLTVEFTATLNAAVLIILAGAITGFELGSIKLAAEVRWQQTKLPLNLKQREIALPGRFKVDPPHLIH